MMTRNDYLLKVNKKKKNRSSYIDQFENGCNIDYRSNYCGLIEEETIVLLIHRSKKNKLLMRFLNAFVFYLDSEEITPKVLNMLVNLKGKYKRSILIGLAHCDLSIFQLFILNQETIDEALIKLIEKYKRQEIKKTDIDIAISYWLKHSPKRLEQIIMQVGSS